MPVNKAFDTQHRAMKALLRKALKPGTDEGTIRAVARKIAKTMYRITGRKDRPRKPVSHENK